MKPRYERLRRRLACVAVSGCVGWPGIALGAAPPTAAPGTTRVHIEVRGPATVGLFRVEGSNASGPGVKVCDAPCDAVVDGSTGDAFVLDGPRMSPSLSFLLVDKPEAIDVVVRPGYRALTIAGWTTVALGVAAALAGGITLTLADDDRTLRRAGGFTLLAGLPLMIGGGLMAAFGRTRHRFAAPGQGGRGRRSRR